MFSAALILLLAAGSCVNSIDLIQPDSMLVQPGQTLTITCLLSGYSVTDSSYGTGWIRQREGKPMDWIFHMWGGGFLNGLHSGVVVSTFALQREDSFNCDNWAFDYWGKGTMVTVSSATSTKPTVFPLIQCGAEDAEMITLGCLATGFTPSSLTFSWTKNNAALTNFIQYPPVQKNNLYSEVSQIQVRRQDWNQSETVKCMVTHAAGNAEAPIVKPKPVVYQLPTIKVCSSDEGEEVSFSCIAKDFSPKSYEIKWLKNGNEVTGQKDEITAPFGERKDSNGNTLYSASSFLSVQTTEWSDGTTFTCVFKGKGENNVEVFKNASVTYKYTQTADVDVNILHPTVEDMFLKRKGTITCQVQINRGRVEKILWQDENKTDMAGAFKVPPKGKKGTFNLELEITYDEWAEGKKRYCVVESEDFFDPLTKLYERNIGAKPQRPSVFMLPPVEQTRKEKVTLTCYVKDFYPQDVFVSWLVDDDEANSDFEFNTTSSVESNGSYSAYGHLTFTLEQWAKPDAMYSCVVYHESLGNTTKTIVRSIGYRTGDKTNLVNLNMNVPETCKAQ
uniref:Ig-like domain-containing protein n=1 Tax=Amphiprion percula TaxID=161767 RepID=A0A3P8RM26_AMPPE